VTTLVIAAHGSADPRSPAIAHAVATRIRRDRPGLDVRVGFCERSAPNLGDVLAGLSNDAVVAPLLLAAAYHARVDIPGLICRAGVRRVRQADVLGEDDRLVQVAHERLAEVGVSRHDEKLGVLVVAVGSSWQLVNARTASVATALSAGAQWAGAVTSFATGPKPSLHEAAARLRRRGASRLVIAPWFLASGRLTDRVGNFARDNGIGMAPPLGAHRLVAATLLDRFDQAIATRVAA
jgi:sirohydrochlorin ferrochelatase